MDSYDLFGEDVGAGMLDGLPDLGSDGFDPAPGQPQSQPTQQQSGPGTVTSAGSAGARSAPPPPYGQMEHLSSLPPENSLQKLANFGEYGSHHRPSPQQHHMDGQGGIYSSPAAQMNHHHHQQQHLAGGGYDTSGSMIGGGAAPTGPLCGPVTYQNPGTSGSGGTMRTNQFSSFCPSSESGIYGLDQGSMVGRNEQAGGVVEVGGGSANDGIRGGGGWNGSTSQSYPVSAGNTYNAPMGSQQDHYRQQMGTYSQQRQPEGQEMGGYCGQDPIMAGGPGVAMSRGYAPMQQRVSGFNEVGGGTENPCASAGVYQGPGVSVNSGTMGQQQVGQGYVNYGQTHHHVQYSTQQPQGGSCEMDVVNQQTSQYNHVQMPPQQHVAQVMGAAAHHHSFVSHRMQVPPVSNHRPHYVGPQHPIPPQQQKVQQMGATTGDSSPQYRTAFPQHSPQMSPRTASIQQRVGSPGPPRMSPRPPQMAQQQLMQMSPVKPCLSPHPGQTTMSPRPPGALTPKVSPGYPQVNPVVGQSSPVPSLPQQSTLQRLEQMVGPPATSDYPQSQYMPDGMNAMGSTTLGVPHTNPGLSLPPQRVLSSLPSSSPLSVPSVQWGPSGHVPTQSMGMDIAGNTVTGPETVSHQIRVPPVSGDPRISQTIGNSSNAQTHVGDESNSNRMQGMGSLPTVDPNCNLPASPRCIPGADDVSLVAPITTDPDQSLAMPEFPAVSSYKSSEMVSVEQSGSDSSIVRQGPALGAEAGDPTGGTYGNYDGVVDGCRVQLGSTPVEMPCPDPRFSGPVGSVGNYPAPVGEGVSATLPVCPGGNLTTAVPSSLSNSVSSADKPPELNSTQTGFTHIPEGQLPSSVSSVCTLPSVMAPHGNLALLYDHRQEMNSLQQQLRELFCMPAQQPIPEVQEKVVRLQERLRLLQQHEATDHCTGGPQCILGPPNAILPSVGLPSTSIDGQVSTVKGRAKGGTPKPKKSRKKKDESGGQTSSEPVTGPDGQPLPPTEGKPKKPKTPRKPREPKKPKEPKPPKEPKEPKEPKRKREPKPPGEGGKTPSKPRRSRSKKKETTPPDAAPAATTATESQVDGEAGETVINTEGTPPDAKIEKSSEAAVTPSETPPGGEVGEGDAGTPATAKPKKPKRDRKGRSPRVSGTPKIRNAKGMFSSFKKKTKNKNGESEVSDLDVTPPPSPEAEADNGVQKRRSARNTHRKKYVDDIELAISEDELHGLLPLTLSSAAASLGPLAEESLAGSPTRGEGGGAVVGGVSGGSGESSGRVTVAVPNESSKRRRNPASASAGGEEEVEGVVKPNFVYINTTDEDSMIVQHVLAVRVGKREVRKVIGKQAVEGEDGMAAEEAEEKLGDEGKERMEEGGGKEGEKGEEEDEEKEKEETGEEEGKENEDTSQSNKAEEMHANIPSEEVKDVSLNDGENCTVEPMEVGIEAKLLSKEEGVTDVSSVSETKVVTTSPKEEEMEGSIIKEEDSEREKEVEQSGKDVSEIKEEEEPPQETKEGAMDWLQNEDELVVEKAAFDPIEEGEDAKKDVSEEDLSAVEEKDVEGEKVVVGSEEGESIKVEAEGKEGLCKVNEDQNKEEEEEAAIVEVIDVEEYFVKYRNFSYLHCEWKTEEELMKGDKRISAKIKRFKQKVGQTANIFENLEDEPFNPDYVEVDRVLDVADHTDPNTGKTTKNYLVKWKGLQYEDATWELEEDLDPIKVTQFETFRELPPKDQWKPKKKPSGEQWEKLELSPVYKNDNTLRAYQLEGLNWLLFSWYNGRNCILADEMGLGKTIQSIAFIHAVFQWGIKRPFLVVAPLSTIPNWQREFEAWTDMNVIVYHGSTASRNMLQEYELFFRDEKGNHVKDLPKFNVLITTFEIIIADCMELREFTWRLCVIDEAHRLKNRNCKLLEGLRLLNLEHRVLLSGTPLQNNVNELFSLLNFLEPSQFGSSESFLQEFGALKSETEVQKLQVLLKPMMLRRLKEDVEKTIAPKEETVIEVELTNIQKKYYRAILERNFSFLSKGTTTANVPNLMNTMMELRKCCIHPYLLNGAEEQIQLEYRQAHGEDPDAYFKALIHSSGKMVLIDKLLPKLKDNGHRVLVFSQMVRCLDILEDYLVYRKYPFERIDGRIRGNLRQAAIDRFCKPDSDRFVFLLCTKAGGLGINLTAADTVIIYDSDWNPQNDLQAQARCHRIGQQKMVKVYRLLCRSTYEREMFDKASLKLGLDRAVLQSMNTAQGGKDPTCTAGIVGQKQLSKKEIEDLLKKGAYGAIMEEDNAGDKFCEEDIEQILERRTQIITLETGEKGSTFSKASFACSGIRSDIDIDDPDFWKKWAKKADIDMSEGGEKNDLVISEPRRRTQIKRYGHDESLVDMSELDSSSDSDDEGSNGIGRGRAGRRCQRSSTKFGRRPRSLSKFYGEDHIPREGEIVYGSWARSECFKVEKGLLTFGWGRWPEILNQGQFRRGWRESDVEDCARVILLYCLRYYHGDDKIKGFIWDLITPTENGESRVQRNHMGLSAPVPRGRKGKKKMKEARMLNAMMEVNDWSRNEKYDGDIFLESNYKKHLTRHANKVLLRVRMLYYIKHEIIGDLVQQIADGVPVKMLEIYPPYCDAPPARWWDIEADKSLLAGTYKHGYERYREIRADPQLSFLAQVGPPPPLPEDPPCSTPSSPPRDTPRRRQPNESAVNLDEDKISEDEEDCMVVEGGSVVSSNIPGTSMGEGDIGASSAQHHTNLSQEHHLTPEETHMRFSQANQATTVSSVVQTNQGPGQYSVSGMSADHSQVLEQHNHGMISQLTDGSTQQQLSDDRENAGAGGTWPSVADLNTRLRRVITSYQRNFKKEELKMAQKAKTAASVPDCRRWPQKIERKDKVEQMLRDREKVRLEINQRRWSRREEADFYRTVSTFGVEYDRKRGRYDWNRFRAISHLERKFDESMTEYYKAFLAMCKRSCGLKLLDDEANFPDMPVEPLPEDKARRTLERIELLRRVREDILSHPRLGERLALCRPSVELPEWWIAGRHDRELLLGAAKHGLGRTEFYILNDPELSFREFVRDGNGLQKEAQAVDDTAKESESSAQQNVWGEGGSIVRQREDEVQIPKSSSGDVLQMDGNEMIVRLEKGEGTLKIERIGVKREPESKGDDKLEDRCSEEGTEQKGEEEQTGTVKEENECLPQVKVEEEENNELMGESEREIEVPKEEGSGELIEEAESGNMGVQEEEICDPAVVVKEEVDEIELKEEIKGMDEEKKEIAAVKDEVAFVKDESEMEGVVVKEECDLAEVKEEIGNWAAELNGIEGEVDLKEESDLKVEGDGIMLEGEDIKKNTAVEAEPSSPKEGFEAEAAVDDIMPPQSEEEVASLVEEKEEKMHDVDEEESLKVESESNCEDAPKSLEKAIELEKVQTDVVEGHESVEIMTEADVVPSTKNEEGEGILVDAECVTNERMNVEGIESVVEDQQPAKEEQDKDGSEGEKCGEEDPIVGEEEEKDVAMELDVKEREGALEQPSVQKPDDDLSDVVEKRQEDLPSKKEDGLEVNAASPDVQILASSDSKDETTEAVEKDLQIHSGSISNPDSAVSPPSSAYWPKDRVLQTRLEHIVHVVEHGEWPSSNTSCLLSMHPQSVATSTQSNIVAMGSSMARLVGGLLGALGSLGAAANRGVPGKGPSTVGDGGMGSECGRNLAEVGMKGSSSSPLPSSDVVTITTTTADHVTLAPIVPRQRPTAVPQSLLQPAMGARRSNELHVGRVPPPASSSPIAHQSAVSNLAPPPPSKKRKRHIAIDVETERAKLHALLNSSSNQSQSSQKISSSSSSIWGGEEESSSNDAGSRRLQGSMQPPPAHQQQGSTRVLSMPLSSYDLGKYHPTTSQSSTPPSGESPSNVSGSSVTPMIKSIGPTTLIPGTSSTLTPIDLSSGLPKMEGCTKNSSEAQDFSMSSKSKQKSKLDDMLDKLMKRKVCVEEPAGKEKKRRKLDEIVLGLSAAREQSLFSEVKKSGTSITPIPLPPSHVASQGGSHRGRHGAPSPQQQSAAKPFTITVTSVPPGQSRPPPQALHGQPPKCQRPQVPGRAHPSSGQLSSPSPSAHPLQQQQQQQQQQQHRMDPSSQLRASQSSAPQTPTTQQQQQQNQRKNVYESMLADLGRVADFSRIGSYSHEAKVNKWLAEQTSLIPERSHAMPQHSAGNTSTAQVVDLQSSVRRRRPRMDPSLLDWKKLSGDENISVINRMTGKKITGNKAPQLKRLGAWLVENPMFDIDPKWAELVKERGNLPRDLQKRLPPGIVVATPGASSAPAAGGDQRKKGPGRPMTSHSQVGHPICPTSSSGHSYPVSSAPSSVTSSPSMSSLAAGLSNLSPALLSGLGLGAFDPKNNPLLMPFGRGTGSNSAAGTLPGLGSMSGLAGLGGLGGVSNLSLANSLFANLAGLNLPSVDSSQSDGTSRSTSGKSRKSDSNKGTSNPNIPTSSAFPFFFPNPSLLYTPLGLGGLNPFSLQPGMSSAYDGLAQQCGLLNGVSTASATPTSNTSSTPTSAGRPLSSQNSRGRPSLASNHRHRAREAKEAIEKQQRHLQRLLSSQGVFQSGTDLEGHTVANEGMEASTGRNDESPPKPEHESSEERTGKQVSSAEGERARSPRDREASDDCGESSASVQSTRRTRLGPMAAGAGMSTGGSVAKRPRPARLEETVSKLKENVVEKKSLGGGVSSGRCISDEGRAEAHTSPPSASGEEDMGAGET